jgi:hypothetical protein
MASLGLGAGLFMLLPRSAFEEVGRFVNASARRNSSSRQYLQRLRAMTGTRLREVEAAFAEMGEIFEQPVKRVPRCDCKCKRWRRFVRDARHTTVAGRAAQAQDRTDAGGLRGNDPLSAGTL